MNEIKYQDVVKTALGEVGKTFTTYTSDYLAFLDSINWYCGKKQGATTWCCAFNDYCVAVNKGDLSYEQARQVVCEPANSSVNYGAGVKEKVQYYKKAGRWITDPSKCTTGDEIFLYVTSNGEKKIGHVGRVVDWDDKYIYTVEGSTTYEGKPHSVGKKSYSFKSTRIAGFGRPDWYKYQVEDAEPKEDPKPEPQPTPEPVKPEKSIDELAKEVIDGKWGNGKERGERLAAAGYDYQAVQNRVNEILGVGKPATGRTYTVKVNSVLNVRSGAGTNYRVVRQLANGTKVTVYETSNGWGRIGNNEWVSMNYLN